jgi:imidazolonepropionase-like amidohydrolase
MRAVHVLMALFGTASALEAAPRQDGEKAAEEPAQGDQPEKEGQAKEEEEEKEKEYFALLDAEIHTGTGAVLRGASILAANGVIEQIGYDLNIPEKATRLDAKGLRAYPGLVAFESAGLLGGQATKDFADTVDPFSQSMVLALSSGITTTGQSGTALKLKRGEIEGVVLRDNYIQSLTWSKQSPVTKRTLREKLEDASVYLRKYRTWEEEKQKNKDLKEPSRQGVDTNALRILKGEVQAKFTTSDRSELLEIARLAQEFRFRPLIEGCVEGWTVADELGRAGAYAVLTPRWRDDKSERQTLEGGSSIENAALLHKAGVQVAVVPSTKGIATLGGISGRDIIHLHIEAGFAVRGGLSEQAALAAITIVPARALGVDHRVGTLEVGKDCDVILTDGDLLHYETFVQMAVVEGKVVYDKKEELFFAHIRPLPEHLAPEQRKDPGEQEPPEEATAPQKEEKEEEE